MLAIIFDFCGILVFSDPIGLLGFGVDRAYHAIVSTLHFPFDPAKRIYWLFLLSSVALVLLLAVIGGKQVNFALIRRQFFSRAYWCHRSSLVDLGCLFGNGFLRVLVLLPIFGSHLLATVLVVRFLQSNFGSAPEFGLPSSVIVITYTLLFFVLEDLSRFALHVAMHKVPALWRLHRLHHSASVLTPLTLHRIHPIEMLLYYMRSLWVFALVSGGFVYLFGRNVSGIDILGVEALGFMFNFFGANLRHSHIWFSYGRFEKWFISPAQHQIHHSISLEHRDRNFGTCLAIWDRLYGSSLRSGCKRRLRFGVA